MGFNFFMERYDTLSIPLYKYYGNLEYAKDVIENNRIHFESPKDYNDVYDSATYITDSQILNMSYPKDMVFKVLLMCLQDKEDIDKFNNDFITSYVEKVEIKIETIIKEFYSFFPIVDKNLALDLFRTVLSLGNIYISDEPKISCFSENRDSLLMWSYYANSHKGVCLEFDLKNDKTLCEHCYKVQYSKHFNVGDESYVYFTKSEEWQHEQEWRIVSYDADYIETQTLKAIYLGYLMEPDDRWAFYKLGIKYKLDVYFVKPSITEYKLEFTQFLKNGVLVLGVNNDF